jgi:hypothetical protein
VQPVLVWKYLETPEVWDMFASTSREVYRLLGLFDTAYGMLHHTRDTESQTSAYDEKSAVVNLRKEWRGTQKAALDPNYKLADEYKKWLPTHMKKMADNTGRYLDEALALIKDDSFYRNPADKAIYTKEIENVIITQTAEYRLV